MSSTSLRPVALWGLLLAAPAARAECRLGVVDLGAAIATVRLAIRDGSFVGADRMVDEVHRNIHCLDFAPSPSLWADWLYVVAETRYNSGRGGWEAPLDRFQTIRPDYVNDQVLLGGLIEGHAFATHQPHEPAVASATLPYRRDDLDVYIDGEKLERQWVAGERMAPTLLDPEGFHLVQINNGVWWDSMIVEGADAVHDLWVPRRQPRGYELWVSGFAGAGAGPYADARASGDDWQPYPFSGPLFGFRGQLTVGRLSMRGQASLTNGADAHLHAVAGFDTGWLGAGVGASIDEWAPSRDDGRTGLKRLVPLCDTGAGEWFAAPTAAVWARGTERRHVDARVLVSALPYFRLSGNVGVSPQRALDPAARVRLGLVASYRHLRIETDPGSEKAAFFRSFVGAEVAIEVARRQVAPDGSRLPGR